MVFQGFVAQGKPDLPVLFWCLKGCSDILSVLICYAAVLVLTNLGIGLDEGLLQVKALCLD